jgi:DNA replication protein DnaC
MTERSEIMEMLAALQLSGMRATYDEVVTMGIKRQQGVERIIHALLKAEIAAKQARSINYQLGVAKMPLAKELAEFSFKGTPINAELVKQLAKGEFLDDKRNIVLVGGTGTGKSHIAIGLTRSIIRIGKKARFFNAVDLANKLELEAKLDRQGRTADGLMRVNLVVIDLGEVQSYVEFRNQCKVYSGRRPAGTPHNSEDIYSRFSQSITSIAAGDRWPACGVPSISGNTCRRA